LTEHGIHVLKSDVTSDKDTAELLNKVEGITCGRLDILINNAYAIQLLLTELRTNEIIGGYVSSSTLVLEVSGLMCWKGYTMPATDTEIHEVEKMFRVNVFGPMRMIRYFHRLLVAAQGTVVNIGSIAGIMPYAYGCKTL
jgi:1-acylglycerone phosphate reductase